MNKNQLAHKLAVSERLPLSTAFKAVDGIIRIIGETLARGEEMAVRCFGIFSPVERAERPARNPHTQEKVMVPAHRTVKFRPSKELKEMLNRGHED
ncbi:MAG: HU family DNA-binding protein [Muribaculaceae bacterium]|nr:HU family DNA-binding protein [Muribaculaceae bacterium]